jgi:hypothetical protein
MLWRDLISRPIATISSLADGDDTTRPLLQGNVQSRILSSFVIFNRLAKVNNRSIGENSPNLVTPAHALRND